MNDRIEDLLNGMAGRFGPLDHVMTFAARDLVFLGAALVLALWFWPGRPGERALNQRTAVMSVFAVVLALAAGSVLHHLHSEARPFVVDGSTRLLIPHAADPGFPSDHALFSFAVAGTVVWWRRRLGLVALAAAALIGIARVYVGVHWPTQIVAGAVVGLLAGALAAWTVPWWTGPQRLLCRFLPPVLLARP